MKTDLRYNPICTCILPQNWTRNLDYHYLLFCHVLQMLYVDMEIYPAFIRASRKHPCRELSEAFSLSLQGVH